MSLIQDNERATYDHMWSAIPDYTVHSPGEKYLPLFLDMAKIQGSSKTSVLDAGCGSGKGAVALAHEYFNVRMCDISDSGLIPAAKRFPFTQICLWDDLRAAGLRADYVYCTDVLEHIPSQFTMLCIHQMLRVGTLFLSVSLVPDSFGVWAGKQLHQTVQPFTWWRDSLKEVGLLIESRDLIMDGVFLVGAK